MLNQPCHQCMVRRDGPVDACLETALEGPEEPSDHHDAQLGATIGLGVVFRGVLLAELLHVAVLEVGQLDDALLKTLQRWLVVALENHASVPKPGDVLAHSRRDVVVLIAAFARDNVRHDDLGAVASDDDALDELAAGACLVHSLLASLVLRVLQLSAPLHPAGRDEEVVDTDDGDG